MILSKFNRKINFNIYLNKTGVFTTHIQGGGEGWKTFFFFVHLSKVTTATKFSNENSPRISNKQKKK